MVGSWISLRVSTVLLITLCPSLCLSGCSEDWGVISCINTNSDDYVYEINKFGLKPYSYIQNIKIKNSYLPIISDFSKGILNNHFTNISINHCNVNKVDDHAFEPSVKILDLSFNNIENMTFVSFLEPGWSVNLSHNRIKNISFVFDYLPVENENNGRDYDYDYYVPPTPKKLIVYSDLDLSHNEIEYVEEDWLPLKNLDLSHNRLIRFYFHKNLAKSSVNLANNNYLESLIFHPDGVQDLNLSNSISRLSNYRETFSFIKGTLTISNTVLESIGNFTHLSNIFISNCSLKTVESLLGPSMKKVDFSHNALTLLNANNQNDFYTNIDDLNLSYNNFKSTSWLFNINPKKVDLSYNKLEELVSSDALIGATYLNLSHNYGLKLSTHSLWNRKNLRVLDLSFCNISDIPDKLFQQSSKLTNLFLQNNQIHHLSKVVFQNLASIDLINLSRNRLTNIEGFLFSSNPVKIIDISNNNISSIASNAFFDLPNLFLISINNNRLLQIENAAFNQLTIQELSLQNCQLTKFNATVLNTTLIRTLNLSGNNLTKIEFPQNFLLHNLELTFDGNLTRKFLKNVNELETLTFHNSTIHNIEKMAFMWLSKLREISFKESEVINVDSGFLNGLFSLEKLDLKTFISNFSTLKNDTFEDLYFLEELDLSQLHIESIQSGAFNSLERMKYLNLSHNELSSIEFPFENLPTLKTLDISFNKLVTLPEGLSLHLKVDHHHNAIDLEKSQSQKGDVFKNCLSICGKSQIDVKSHF